MTDKMNAAAVTAREAARLDSGQFGEQVKADPGDLVLVDRERMLAEFFGQLPDIIDNVFGGEAANLIVEVGRHFGVAVAYQDRGTFEASFRPLSDREWEAVKPELDSYDEWLDNSGAADSIAFWRDQVLDDAGIVYDDEG